MREILILRKAKEGFKNHEQDIYKNRKRIQGCFAFIDYLVPYAMSYTNNQDLLICRNQEPLHIKFVEKDMLVWGRNFIVSNWIYTAKTNSLKLRTRKIKKNKKIDDFIEFKIYILKERVEFLNFLKEKYNTTKIEFSNSSLIEYMINEIVIEL